MQDTKPDKKTPTPEAKAIAGAVRAVMARRGIKQTELRTALRWKKSYFDRRICGQVEMSISDLIAIGGALNCQPDDLVSDALADLRQAVAA